ncbi:MAG TPA: GAF domain-containing protein, partial [Terrimicrobiaceae bacterium]
MSRPSDEISSDFNGLTRLATAVRDLARDAPLSATLDALALVIENEDDGLVCGFCVLDPEGRLVTESCGPSLSENYKHSLLGSDLGELTTGPCAYAIRDKKAIFVEDIASDPRWVGSSWLK